jgi:hypothetical protein
MRFERLITPWFLAGAPSLLGPARRCGYAIFSDAAGLLYEKGARTAPVIASVGSPHRPLVICCR